MGIVKPGLGIPSGHYCKPNQDGMTASQPKLVLAGFLGPTRLRAGGNIIRPDALAFPFGNARFFVEGKHPVFASWCGGSISFG
jgi:hypothetical protein